MRSETVVLVNAQVSAVAQLPKPGLDMAQASAVEAQAALPGGQRALYTNGRWLQADVYDRTALQPGMNIDGPAIIEQVDSTAVLSSGDRGRVDRFRNFILRVTA